VKRGDWEFEWDPEKARANLRKHGVSFFEATIAFLDEHALDLQDRAHPDRLVLIGYSEQLRLLFTVFVELHATCIRIISARRATREERREYERRRK